MKTKEKKTDYQEGIMTELRAIRDQIGKDIKNMSAKEIREYIKAQKASLT